MGDLDAAKTIDRQLLSNMGTHQVGGGKGSKRTKYNGSKAMTMKVFTKQCGRNFMKIFSKKLLYLVERLRT